MEYHRKESKWGVSFEERVAKLCALGLFHDPEFKTYLLIYGREKIEKIYQAVKDGKFEEPKSHKESVLPLKE